MIPQAFDYAAPASLEEAISLLHEHGESAKILSGGHSLIPMMKLRLATPEVLIDINNIPGLSYIKEENGVLKIGGLTREVDLENSEVIRSKYPVIYDAAKMIADPQVRNQATIGGNLAHGDAANDHPAVMIALNAQIVATGSSGERVISIHDFFKGFYMTALEPGEILTEIRIPAPPQASGNAYLKLERKVGDYATAGVAVHLEFDRGLVVKKAGIGLTNVGPAPIRAETAEQVLIGKVVDDALLNQAGQFASDDSSPTPDLRGSEAYKRAMVKELTKRAIKIAINRSK